MYFCLLTDQNINYCSAGSHYVFSIKSNSIRLPSIWFSSVGWYLTKIELVLVSAYREDCDHRHHWLQLKPLFLFLPVSLCTFSHTFKSAVFFFWCISPLFLFEVPISDPVKFVIFSLISNPTQSSQDGVNSFY